MYKPPPPPFNIEGYMATHPEANRERVEAAAAKGWRPREMKVEKVQG